MNDPFVVVTRYTALDVFSVGPEQAFFATTAKGIEDVLADELRGLGVRVIETRTAGVAFAGPLEAAYRACLWSRTANRVLLPVASFAVRDAEALYAGVRGIPWGEHLGPRETLAVDFTGVHATLTHSRFAAQKTKDAVVDRLRDETGARPSVDTARPSVRINVHVEQDRATVSIDLSGESLHRRGYRTEAGAAPLKENLAAAILLIAGWPARAEAGGSFLDPMCGAGTLPIEAALIAARRAPGIERAYWGFAGWHGHDERLWRRLVAEARAGEIHDPARLPPIHGQDQDERVLAVARDNARRAGVETIVCLARGSLAEAAPPSMTPENARGLFVVNPPYGERLGETPELRALYAEIGDVLRRRFLGWDGYVLTGNPALAKQLGLRPARRHVLYNGAIECRLLELPIASEAPRQGPDAGPAWRRPRPPSPAVAGLVNRLKKNHARLGRWAASEGVTCYRVYDADLPEYALAIDLYEGAVVAQEYAPPKEIDPARATERLEDALAALPGALGVTPENVFFKVRRRQTSGAGQYQRLGTAHAEREVHEGGHRFLVNLSDFLDTGLFLDQRRVRRRIAELAPGRRFLNLFGYTATATVYAARAGARSTTTVDLSRTYLDWAARNLALNGVRGRAHELVPADCFEWLARAPDRYGLILCAPPTFSNSKRMHGTFDVQRDHGALLGACARRLEVDGVLLFTTHDQRFRLDEAAVAAAGLEARDVTRETLPRDFERSPRIHRAYHLVPRIAAARPGRGGDRARGMVRA